MGGLGAFGGCAVEEEGEVHELWEDSGSIFIIIHEKAHTGMNKLSLLTALVCGAILLIDVKS